MYHLEDNNIKIQVLPDDIEVLLDKAKEEQTNSRKHPKKDEKERTENIVTSTYLD